MKAIIFAGGVGTRLWPLSRKNTPKQFEKILGDNSMLQLAVSRLRPDFKEEDIFIATGKHYQHIVQKQLPYIPKQNIIVEPEMRDVGPAVGLVASMFAKRFPHEPIAVLWGSDHLVKEKELFNKVLQYAGELIQKENNKIIFIGQKPRFANQNLGWIEFGRKISKQSIINIYEFKGLTYRPDFQTTRKFFEGGHHAWNLGYFVTTPVFLCDLFRQFAPKIFKKLQIIREAVDTPVYQKTLQTVYPTIEKISFDNAVLEKLDPSSAFVISENFGWSDVGAWEALKEALETKPKANVIHGKVHLVDTNDSLIYNLDNDKLVVGIDLDEHIVVNTQDVLLITKKNSVPKIKKLVESFTGTKHEKLT